MPGPGSLRDSALDDGEEPVDLHTLDPLHITPRPHDLDDIGHGSVTEPETHPQVTLRKVTVASLDLLDLLQVPRPYEDAGPYAVAPAPG